MIFYLLTLNNFIPKEYIVQVGISLYHILFTLLIFLFCNKLYILIISLIYLFIIMIDLNEIYENY